MAIPDPHAVPETADACTEYVTEADAAWDSSDSDHAYDLYHSVRNSALASSDQYSHVNFRLGLIAQTRGQNEEAVGFFHSSHEAGAADALHALTNATTNDPTPSADQIPQSAEQAWAWAAAGVAATQAQDWEQAYGLYNAAAQSSHIAPGQQATLYLHAGTALEQLGRTEEARHTYELALSMASNQDDIDFIRGRIKVLGGGEATADDASAAAAEVAAGVIAYENGDAAGARTAFEAALHLDGTDAEKGRAQYYLGAMDYQAHQYANARNHVEAAAKNAPEPEKGWAQGMLQWRWDEHPAAPAAGAASPAAPGAPYSPTEI